MKLLLMADMEQQEYWYPSPEMLEDIDLILSAGDLKPEYLNRLAAAGLATAGKTYLLYVHGNHDSRYPADLSKNCVDADGDLLIVKGLRILGLGGSLRYKPGPYQYSEEEMLRRIDGLAPKIRDHHGVDIILTHVPPRGIGDRNDPVHRGFDCFLPLLDRVKPVYLVHGHVHLPEEQVSERIKHYGETAVINACGSYLLEF